MTLDKKPAPAPEARSKAKSASAVGRVCRRPETIVLMLLTVFVLAFTWETAPKNMGGDFYQYWVVGQAMHQPRIHNVYSDEACKRLGAEFLDKAKRAADPTLVAIATYRQTLQIYSSPFLYAMFGLFSTGHYETDFRNYQLLLLACLILGIGVVCALLNHSVPTTLAAIAIFSTWFTPFTTDLRVGNVNSLQFAVLAVYLWVIMRMRWRQRDILGGALLGLVVAFKPNLVPVAGVLAIYWAASRQIPRLWLHAAGGAAGGMCAILFTAADFGNFHCWTDWLSALRSLPDQIITVKLGNFAPAQLLFESLGLHATLMLALIFGGLTALMLWNRQWDQLTTTAIRPAVAEFPEVFVVAIGCLLVLLISPLVWLHYYVLTIPAFLFLWRAAGTTSGQASSILCHCLWLFALLMFAAVPLGLPLSYRERGALAACAALLLFFAFVILARGKTVPAHNANEYCLVPNQADRPGTKTSQRV